MQTSNRRELVKVHEMKKYFPVEKGFMKRTSGMVKAVDGVSFSIYEGETLGMVGESGCGKSTIGKTMLRVYDLTEGSVVYDFGDKPIDVTRASDAHLRQNGFRQRTQMIFQDPNSSLDPRMTVYDIISEPMLAAGGYSKAKMAKRTQELMEHVGLDARYLKRYPHAFSGGQRQRISIARALSTNPRFIVADEPTSALDVSIQAQILNLMQDLQKQFSLTYLFVSHNLGVIRKVSDRIAVMYLGHMVELADNESTFMRPMHPYTQALMKAIPVADPNVVAGLESAPGEIGNPLNPPPGCTFHPRCQYATDQCKTIAPALRDMGDGHFVACHLAGELALHGITHRTLTR